MGLHPTFWAGVILVSLVTLFPKNSHAAACCSSATMPSVGRLKVWEEAAVGMAIGAKQSPGRWDHEGKWLPQDAQTHDDSLAGSLWAMVRTGERWEVHLGLPMRYGMRQEGLVRGQGGGIGDAWFLVRREILAIGEVLYLPAIALYAGTRIPSGRRLEMATEPLAADTTGQGAWVPMASAVLEKAVLPYFFQGAFVMEYPMAFTRQDNGAKQREGLLLGARLAAGLEVIPDRLVMSLAGSVNQRGVRQIDGAVIPQSEQHLVQLGIYSTWQLNPHWALQLGVYGNPPSSELGKNLTANYGADIGIRYGRF